MIRRGWVAPKNQAGTGRPNRFFCNPTRLAAAWGFLAATTVPLMTASEAMAQTAWPPPSQSGGKNSSGDFPSNAANMLGNILTQNNQNNVNAAQPGNAGRGDLSTMGLVQRGAGVVGKAIDAADDRFGPADAFYLGREVAAQLVGDNPVLRPGHPQAEIVTSVGRTLALASHAPHLYQPYTFIVTDNPDVNAFAAPGGLIIMTTGMLNFLRNEDELAFVLGHELGHIEQEHNLADVSRMKIGAAMQGLGEIGSDYLAEEAGNDMVGQVVRGVSDEIVGAVIQGVENGYSADVEGEADLRGASMAQAAGYAPAAALDVLERFRSFTGGYGGAQYPQERGADMQAFLSERGWLAQRPDATRTARFREAMAQDVTQTAYAAPGTSASTSLWAGSGTGSLPAPAFAGGSAPPLISRQSSRNPIRRAGQATVRPLATLYFGHGSARLAPQARRTLDNLARDWRQHRRVLLIEGHASPSAPPESREITNFRMSERRVNQVLGYLRQAGVDRNAMKFGFYSDNYTANGQTDDWDRRVEISLRPR